MNAVQYYGIDIGDGESAAAAVSDQGAVLPRVLMLGSAKSVLSVVGELDGKPVIGDQAMLLPGVEHISARFKSRFLQDPAASYTIAQFAQGLRAAMGSELSGAGEIQIALGCPAGWTAQDRQKYASIVGAAGFPNLHTVAESRAAFLYAHYDADIGLSAEELAQPALVVDIGSSTTDFAYIVEGKESEVGVFGNVRLGGGLLDRLILDDAVEHSPKRDQIRAVFAEFPSWRSLCELKAREAKEKYFASEGAWVDQPFKAKVPIYAGDGVISLTLCLDAERVNTLLAAPISELGDVSFVEKLRQSLALAAEHTAAHPPRQLILTGGASRMAFFQDACRAAFPGAKVTVCKEPEFTIARGLGIASRIDHKLSFFRRDIQVFFDSGDLRADIARHLPDLQAKLLPVLLKRVMEHCVKPALNEKGQNGRQLKEAIRASVRKEFEQEGRTAQTDEVVARWIAGSLTKAQGELDAICARNDVERADMALSRLAMRLELDQLRFLPGFLPDVVLDIIRNVPLVGPVLTSPLLRSGLERALRKAMLDPGGAFAKGLASGLERELGEQIQKNVEKVEIHIS